MGFKTLHHSFAHLIDINEAAISSLMINASISYIATEFSTQTKRFQTLYVPTEL